MCAHALPSCVQRGLGFRGECKGGEAYRAGAGQGGKVRGGRRQAGWPTAKALNLTDGEG